MHIHSKVVKYLVLSLFLINTNSEVYSTIIFEENRAVKLKYTFF